MWQIAPELRAMVQFRPLNLLQDFTPLGLFDVVFCRNVLIYFDQATKIDVLERMARQLPDDGYLVLGAAETVVGLTGHASNRSPKSAGLYSATTAVRNAFRRQELLSLLAAKSLAAFQPTTHYRNQSPACCYLCVKRNSPQKSTGC